jgi:glycosyltransferase involved in cell wall biosynthesis
MKPRIAIVHDWLVTYAGAERCLEAMLKCFPEAELFSVVNFLPAGQQNFIQNKFVKTTFIQHLPFASKHYRQYLPLMPWAISRLDVSQYDIVISSSHAVAKGIRTHQRQLHLCYIYTPMRYAWDLQDQYLTDANLAKGLKGWLVKKILNWLRAWDLNTAKRVNDFIAISQFIRERVKKVYSRDADVIYPPVAVDQFQLQTTKQDFYVTASRLVSYKKVDLIVKAFLAMPDKKLVVIGTGPDYAKIAELAAEASNIKVLGYQATEKLKTYMQQAQAFIFAAEEDFGIAPLEAQACGTPVIAFAKGGALETVVDLNQPQATGVFFYQQTEAAIIEAVKTFEQQHSRLLAINCRQNAERFADRIFCEQFEQAVLQKYKAFSKANIAC